MLASYFTNLRLKSAIKKQIEQQKKETKTLNDQYQPLMNEYNQKVATLQTEQKKYSDLQQQLSQQRELVRQNSLKINSVQQSALQCAQLEKSIQSIETIFETNRKKIESVFSYVRNIKR